MRNRVRLNVEELESRLTPSVVVTNERPPAPESYVEGTRTMIMTVIFRETGVETVNIEQFSIDELVSAYPNSPIDRIGLRMAGSDHVFAEMGAEAYEEQTRFRLSGSPLFTLGVGEIVRIEIDAWFKDFDDVIHGEEIIEDDEETEEGEEEEQLYVFPNISFLTESPAVIARTLDGEELTQNDEGPDNGRMVFIGVEPGEGRNQPLRGNPAPFVEQTDVPELEPEPPSPPIIVPELPRIPTQGVSMVDVVPSKKNDLVVSQGNAPNTPATVTSSESIDKTEESEPPAADFRVAPGNELQAEIDEVFRRLWQILCRMTPAKAD